MLPGTALLLPAQNTYTLHDPIRENRDAEHARRALAALGPVLSLHVMCEKHPSVNILAQ